MSNNSRTTPFDLAVIEALARFPGHDFLLRFDHRTEIWTATAENDAEIISLGSGATIMQAAENMRTTQPKGTA